MESEGQAINRPPLFNGSDYGYWKKRMIAFLDAQNLDIWDLIESGYTCPKTETGADLPRASWNVDQKIKYQLNLKAKHYLMCAISRAEHDKVHSCENAKEIWDTLALAHEGSSQVKESKISILVHQYELFKMADHETIVQMFGRFQTITNNLRSLGKVYESKDHVRKILRSLSKKWRPKVTAIQEAKDLNTLSLEEMLGSLKVHELELNGEDGSKKEKSIALKAKKSSSSKSLKAEEASDEEPEGSEASDSGEDELSFISRKIQHMWKKKGGFRGRQFNKWNPKDKTDQKDKSAPVCYECHKPGHFKSACPDLKDKKKPDRRRKRIEGEMG